MLLRTRVTIIVFITYALMVGGLIFAGLKNERVADERYAQATLNGQDIFWRKLVENKVQRLDAAIPALGYRAEAAVTGANGNPAALREAFAGVGEAMASWPDVTRAEVINSSGELLYSSTGSVLGQPLIDAGMIRQILDSGKAKSGIVQDGDRGFIATVAIPLGRGGGTILTLGADLKPPLDEFKASTGSDIFLVDRAGRLAMGTDPELWSRFEGKISVRKSRLETWPDGGQFFSVVVLPLHDGDDRVIGGLVTVRDFTATQAQQTFIRRVALVSVAGLFLAVLLGFWIYLSRSFTPLEEAINVLNALSRGDTSVRLEVANDQDEIGRIAGAVGVFRDNAVKLELLEQRRERQRRRQELFIRLQMRRLSDMLEAEARAAVLADLAEIEALAAAPSEDDTAHADHGEIAVLAKAFQTMSGRIREQHGHLQELITERTRDVEILREALQNRDQLAALRQELDFARELQLSSLPQVFPPFPDRNEFRIHAAMLPAKEVGGDFYDFFLIDRHHLGFVIGDASGKGVPAAMFIAITRSLVKSVAPLSASPAECLAFVNTMLSADNPQTLFATAFYGVLDTRSGDVTFSNAGHPPPLVLRQGGVVEMIKGDTGVALGVMEDLDYENGRFSVAPGDSLLLYTDGVTEATDTQQHLFEEGRLIKVLGGCKGLAPDEIIGRVEAAVQGFVGEAPQFDDITMLVLAFDQASLDAEAGPGPARRLMLTGFAGGAAPPIPAVDPVPAAPPAPPKVVPLTLNLTKVKPPATPAGPPPEPGKPVPIKVSLANLVRPQAPPPRRMDATIANDLSELERLAKLVDEFVAKYELDRSVAFNINLCLDELITNTVSYGYDDAKRHAIDVSCWIEGEELVTEVRDDAKAYNPFTEAPEPELDAGVSERNIGGLGVFFVKQFMSRTAYRRDGNRNVVTLWKSIEKET